MKRLQWIVLVALLIPTSVPPGAAAEVFAYPPASSLDEVRRWIDEAPKTHPRLLTTGAELRGLREAVRNDTTRRTLADVVVAQAEAMQGLPPITRTQTGRRLLHQSRRALKRTLTLATAVGAVS